MMEIILGSFPVTMIQKSKIQNPPFFHNNHVNYPNLTTDRKSRRFLKKMKPLEVISISFFCLTECMIYLKFIETYLSNESIYSRISGFGVSDA